MSPWFYVSLSGFGSCCVSPSEITGLISESLCAESLLHLPRVSVAFNARLLWL